MVVFVRRSGISGMPLGGVEDMAWRSEEEERKYAEKWCARRCL
jgi:hypothetical protein